MMETRGPHPVDAHVGARVRLRRTLVGMSQEQLGGKLGLTFQQVQKYEKGTNRISASRLWEISRILEVPVEFFFSGSPEPMPNAVAGFSDIGQSPIAANPPSSDSLQLLRHYTRISDPRTKRAIVELAKALSHVSSPEQDETAEVDRTTP